MSCDDDSDDTDGTDADVLAGDLAAPDADVLAGAPAAPDAVLAGAPAAPDADVLACDLAAPGAAVLAGAPAAPDADVLACDLAAPGAAVLAGAGTPSSAAVLAVAVSPSGHDVLAGADCHVDDEDGLPTRAPNKAAPFHKEQVIKHYVEFLLDKETQSLVQVVYLLRQLTDQDVPSSKFNRLFKEKTGKYDSTRGRVRKLISLFYNKCKGLV